MSCSVFAALSSLVSIDVIDDFFNILDCLSPDQVFVTSLSFNIELLGGCPLCRELFSILWGPESDGELLDLGLTF